MCKFSKFFHTKVLVMVCTRGENCPADKSTKIKVRLQLIRRRILLLLLRRLCSSSQTQKLLKVNVAHFPKYVSAGAHYRRRYSLNTERWREEGHLYETWPIKHSRQRNRMDERVVLVLR